MRNLAIVLLLSLASCSQPAFARDVTGEWHNAPDNVRAWAKAVRSPRGVPCCDIADGHKTDYEIRNDGYWIPIPEAPPSKENWMLVPTEAIVSNAGNPVGEAVVWWVRQSPTQIYVRCFVPGGGV